MANAGAAVHVSSEEEFDQLLETADRVLVEFYADWCGPCERMAPMIDDLAAEREAPVLKVDVDGLPQVASRCGVRSIPTFISFVNGDEQDRLVGMQEKESLANTLE